mgnify:CR=1 FL=1
MIHFAYDPAIAHALGPDAEVTPPDLWPLWQIMGEKPVLVLRGALSDVLSAQTVERMAQVHPGPFAHADIPGRGHAPLLDEAIRRGDAADPEILGNDTVVVGLSNVKAIWRDALAAIPALAIFRPLGR